MVEIIAAAWATWAILNLLIMITAPWIISRDSAFTNGIVIVIPKAWHDRLTVAEIEAVTAHERGHRAMLHIWKKVIRVSVFCLLSQRECQQQELEADDWAARRSDPRALASALRKLSTHPFDLFRAERLENHPTCAIGYFGPTMRPFADTSSQDDPADGLQ